MAHGQLNPKASAQFDGAALTQGFEFRIAGRNQPDLELVLDPGVSFYTQNAGVKDRSGMVHDSVGLGQGRGPGWFSTGIAMINRKIGGENFILTRLSNVGDVEASVKVSAPGEGDIVAINLDEINGHLMCKRGNFLAAPKGVRVGWSLDWSIPSLLFGEQTFLYQSIRSPSRDVAAELGAPGTVSETGEHLSRNWVFLHAPGDVTVRELHPDRPAVPIRRGALLAMTPHTERGAWFTKNGIISNAYNLMQQGDGETFLSPTFKARGNDIIDVKGPCRIWTTNVLDI